MRHKHVVPRLLFKDEIDVKPSNDGRNQLLKL